MKCILHLLNSNSKIFSHLSKNSYYVYTLFPFLHLQKVGSISTQVVIFSCSVHVVLLYDFRVIDKTPRKNFPKMHKMASNASFHVCA